MESIKEARMLTLKYLRPIVEAHGFTVKLYSGKQSTIERKTAGGMDILTHDMLNYSPTYQIRYAFCKVNDLINDIMLRYQEKVKMPLQDDKKSWSLFFSWNTLHKPNTTNYLPYMKTEEEVQQCVALMQSFIEDPALPLLARFEDLREVDRIINGDEPWETDWQKTYVLGWNFYLKRLIISKLAGMGNYDRICLFVNDYYTSRFDDPEYGQNFRDRMGEVEKMYDLLKDVAPLY